MIRSHPLYVLACILIAVVLQWRISRRLKRATMVARQQNDSDDPMN